MYRYLYKEHSADPTSVLGQSVQIYGGQSGDGTECTPTTAVAPHQCSILDLRLRTNAIRRTSLRTLTQSNALSHIWDSTGHTFHASQVRTSQSERCVACSLEAFLFAVGSMNAVCSHIPSNDQWLTSIAKDWEGNGRGLI